MAMASNSSVCLSASEAAPNYDGKKECWRFPVTNLALEQSFHEMTGMSMKDQDC